ncbi:hypothetical protein GTZ99_15165 [Novosphingobium sp. FSY-8]|uniref:HPP transmembrane region domain-containing protein n=1 Tax=Novosphingobium ovatum TaxID=1908523 RepID=A0ABW9XHE4_9SPHN|nr:HPP family protein [Novosphingobium ovatum]NBC37894.1 hypothetical protein [Novosphingobium ovatum]
MDSTATSDTAPVTPERDWEPELPPRPTPLVEKPAWRRVATGAIGAFLGILLTGLVSRMVMADSALLPWLVAPMGASAVLLFIVPASPLAQPWPVIGGNLVASAVGLVVHRAGMPPVMAAAVAVGLSCVLMLALRCLHPPAGGSTLVLALASPPVAMAGWRFLLMPVGVNVVLLVLLAVVWNRLTGHSYPHRARPAVVAVPPSAPFALADIQAVLDEWPDEIDVSPNDLAALMQAVLRRAQG